MDIFKINTKWVYCIGDIHGNLESIPRFIKEHKLTECSLIFCGDVGLGFNSPKYYEQIFRKIEKLCKEKNVYCLFIRGNHDDPAYFNCDEFKTGNMLTLKDYTVLQFEGLENGEETRNVLCVGGAISIDRTYRNNVMTKDANEYIRWHKGLTLEEAKKKVHQCYWDNEKPVFDIEKLNEITDAGIVIDTVCTHTAPTFCEPFTKDEIIGWLNVDAELTNDIDEERKCMDMIRDYLVNNGHKVVKWIYAHYHFHSYQEIEGVTYILLDMEHYGNYDMVVL